MCSSFPEQNTISGQKRTRHRAGIPVFRRKFLIFPDLAPGEGCILRVIYRKGEANMRISEAASRTGLNGQADRDWYCKISNTMIQ